MLLRGVTHYLHGQPDLVNQLCEALRSHRADIGG
jgi:hypothetical protein